MERAKESLTPEMFRDGIPWGELERLRTEAPIFQMVLPDGTLAWNLVRYADVAEGLRDVQRYATPNPDAPVRFGPAAVGPDQRDAWSLHAMILLNAPVHGPYRQQFTGLMKRDLLEQFRKRVRAVAEVTVREARALGNTDGVEHCAAPAATAFVCDYLRIAPENRDYVRRLAAVF